MSNLRKVQMLFVVLGVVVPTGAAAGFPRITLDAQHDARINLGGYDQGTPTYFVDTETDYLGPDVRIAPTGRDEPTRPFPGFIEENRAVMEFDLTGAPGADAYSAVRLCFHISWFQTDVATTGWFTEARIGFVGEAGDGLITQADFERAGATDLGLVDVTGTGWHWLDVTTFIQDMLQAGATHAGITSRVAVSSLPPRASFPNYPNEDYTFQTSMGSADYLGGSVAPYLEFVPEPATLVLLTLAGVAVLGCRRRSR